MKRALLAIALCVISPAVTRAHPAPFTYVDLKLTAGAASISLVAHVFDVAHDLGVEPPERLLVPTVLTAQQDAIVALLLPRLQLAADRSTRPITWSGVTPLPDRQSIQLRGSFSLQTMPGAVVLDAALFPYDPVHQTFVNVYEADTLSLQAILDRSKTQLTYYAGTRGGAIAVLRRFVGEGVLHVVTAPEHVIFLIALVLLGGSPRQLTFMVTAFVIGQAIALTLGTQTTFRPPFRIVEPAGALALIYLGADNMMVKGGRDVRVWIGVAAGVLHGFGFAHRLQTIDLSSTAGRWALVGFNVGMEIVVLAGGLLIGIALMRIRERLSAKPAAALVSALSIAAILGGVGWFIQRVFFPAAAA